MREILSRGKTKDGEWAEGFYVFQEKEQCKDKPRNLIFRNNALGVYGTEVIPETVGQYTEVKDIAKRKIFSGDITSFTTDLDEDCVGYVDYHKETASYRVFADEYTSYILSHEHLSDLKIIGNKTDNPELLA